MSSHLSDLFQNKMLFQCIELLFKMNKEDLRGKEGLLPQYPPSYPPISPKPP